MADLVQAVDRVRNAALAHRNASTPAAVAGLSSSLVPMGRWIGQQWAQARASADSAVQPGGTPPPPGAVTTQLAALGGLTAGMQAAATGYLSGALSPQQAAAAVQLASNTVLTLVNSFRVAIQAQSLVAYDAQPGPAGAGSPAPAPGCCEYADLLALVGIQRLLGFAGAANVAAYTVAFDADAERLGADAQAAANGTVPVRSLLAGVDPAVLTLAGLGSLVLVPPPGALPPEWLSGPGMALDPAVWANTSQALATRCGTAPCALPAATQARARIAQETLAASLLNLVGYVLYSIGVQLNLALAPGGGSLGPIQEPAPDQPMAWAGTLMRQFQGRVRQTLPDPVIATLLDTVPEPTAAEIAAFPAPAPGAGGAEALPAVLQVLARTIQDQYWPTLAGLDAGASLPSSQYAGMLSGLYRMAAAGLRQGTAGAGAGGADQPAWQFYSSVTDYAKYALAAANGYRTGALDRRAAATVLGDIADALQLLFFGWSVAYSAVPIEIARLYQQGAVGPLTRARARALGLDDPAGAAPRRCQEACRQERRGYQELAQQITRNATRTYLAAYIEAVTGNVNGEVLDFLDLVPAPTPAADPSRASARRLLQAGPPASTAPPLPAVRHDPAQAAAGTALPRHLRPGLRPAAGRARPGDPERGRPDLRGLHPEPGHARPAHRHRGGGGPLTVGTLARPLLGGRTRIPGATAGTGGAGQPLTIVMYNLYLEPRSPGPRVAPSEEGFYGFPASPSGCPADRRLPEHPRLLPRPRVHPVDEAGEQHRHRLGTHHHRQGRHPGQPAGEAGGGPGGRRETGQAQGKHDDQAEFPVPDLPGHHPVGPGHPLHLLQRQGIRHLPRDQESLDR
jgi:hypothetical protein